MSELHWYLLFLLAWTFFQSLWLSKLARQVAGLRAELDDLKSARR